MTKLYENNDEKFIISYDILYHYKNLNLKLELYMEK